MLEENVAAVVVIAAVAVIVCLRASLSAPLTSLAVTMVARAHVIVVAQAVEKRSPAICRALGDI